jgi:hypothetical protein
LPSEPGLPAPTPVGGALPSYAPLPPLPPTARDARPAAAAPIDTHAVVDLYNATAHNGLAATVGDWLSASGWPVDKTGGAATQSRTTILYGKGAAKAAAQLAQTLGVPAVPAPSGRTAAGHVLIRLGADYTPPGGPQPATPSDTTGPDGTGTADPANPDPSAALNPADSPGIAMDNGITCVN